MKKFLLLTIVVAFAGSAVAQMNVSSVTAAEYFIGTDPGVGAGIGIPLATSGSIVGVTEEASINVSGLNAGTYTVGVRFKDNTGQWGNPVYQRFTIYPDNYQLATPAASADGTSLKVVAAEYFLGNDPGAGRGTQIPIATAALVGTVQDVAVPVAGLAQGNYRVGIRFKSADGQWGSPVYTGFSIFDIFEAPVNHAPTDILLSNAILVEGTAIGTVFSALSSVDQDGDASFVYTLVPGIGSDDNGLFTLQGAVLKTAGNIDYETSRNHTLNVRIRTADPGGAYTEVPLTLSVLNITNDDDAVLSAWKGNGTTLTPELLSKYAIGGAASPNLSAEAMSVARESNFLAVTALVRINDGSLFVVGEKSSSVNGPWTTDNVTSTTSGLSQSGIPIGFERRKYLIPYVADRAFFRLRVLR
jgi:hypothetical protein